MDATPAIYLGKIVDKKHFRAFIYNINGDKKLIESWDDYEHHMQSGLWFAMLEDAVRRIPVEKSKRIRKPASIKPKEFKADVLSVEDDFLPQAGE